MEELGYIEKLGNVFEDYAPFYKQLKYFRKKGIKMPVSVRDASLIRLNNLNINGTRTCHAPIHYKDSSTIIARISPLVTNLQMAQKAVNAHRNGEYPVFDNEIYRQWEKIAKQDKRKNPEKRRAIILSDRNDFLIHKDSDEANFFFQDARKHYFERLVSKDNIKAYQINLENVDSVDGTIVNYVWFNYPLSGSDLVFWDWDLYFDSRAFGVLDKSPQGSKKISGNLVKSYTEREAKRYIGILEDVMSGKAGTSKLEKVLKHFKK